MWWFQLNEQLCARVIYARVSPTQNRLPGWAESLSACHVATHLCNAERTNGAGEQD
jgi:hypothetical protein